MSAAEYHCISTVLVSKVMSLPTEFSQMFFCNITNSLIIIIVSDINIRLNVFEYDFIYIFDVRLLKIKKKKNMKRL